MKSISRFNDISCHKPESSTRFADSCNFRGHTMSYKLGAVFGDQGVASIRIGLAAILCSVSFLSLGCVPNKAQTPRIEPAREYADRVFGRGRDNSGSPTGLEAYPLVRRDDTRLKEDSRYEYSDPRAAMKEYPIDQNGSAPKLELPSAPTKNIAYRSPLEFGDPGATASLWRENRGISLMRDIRAFAPMDLISILIIEDTEARSQADTKLSKNSSFEAAITSLLGLDSKIEDSNNSTTSPLSLDNAIGTETTSEFNGKGETNRRGRLRGTVSAMVAEVLPSGILRIEGQKIISTNGEEEVMTISGLVRPEDVNTMNEIDSRKIANMRIDYSGRGTVGRQQSPGWAIALLDAIWPF